MSRSPLQVAELALPRCFEWVGFDPSWVGPAGEWPMAPGEQAGDATSDAAIWHFSPRRWLLIGAAAVEACRQAEREGHGAVVEVSGKYRRLLLSGTAATRALSTSFDVEAVLSQRACAAVTLLDAPGIVAAAGSGWAFLVQSSYAEHLLRTLARLPGAAPDG